MDPITSTIAYTSTIVSAQSTVAAAQATTHAAGFQATVAAIGTPAAVAAAPSGFLYSFPVEWVLFGLLVLALLAAAYTIFQVNRSCDRLSSLLDQAVEDNQHLRSLLERYEKGEPPTSLASRDPLVGLHERAISQHRQGHPNA